MLALDIKNLVKTYDSGVPAVQGVSLEVKQGDFFALLGPNGAGKTTIIGIISSLVRKTSGSVKIFGQDLDRNNTAVKSYLGLVPQELNFNQFETVFEIVVNQAGYYGLPRAQAKLNAEKYLKSLDLWGKKDTIGRNLSGGMKRRLMIARALVHEPQILILDEPTAGVDIELRRSMWEFLEKINREQNITIILTTHYLEEAEYLCRGIAIISHGKIVANTTVKELLLELKTETVILDLEDPCLELPNIDNYNSELIDSRTIEVSFSKHYGINEFFEFLNQQKIKVISLRTKRNRLEELFLQFTGN